MGDLSPRMIEALRSMPVLLTDHGNLPASAPRGGTLRALERRGLIRLRNRCWVRTAFGDSVLAAPDTGEEG